MRNKSGVPGYSSFTWTVFTSGLSGRLLLEGGTSSSMNNPCYSCQLAGDQVHAYQRVRARGFSRSSPALIARCKRRSPWRNIVGQRFSRNRGRRDGSRRVARETQMPRACSHAAPVTRSAGVGFFFSADPATVPCNILIAGTRKRYASRRLHARPLAFQT